MDGIARQKIESVLTGHSREERLRPCQNKSSVNGRYAEETRRVARSASLGKGTSRNVQRRRGGGYSICHAGVDDTDEKQRKNLRDQSPSGKDDEGCGWKGLSLNAMNTWSGGTKKKFIMVKKEGRITEEAQ